MIEQLDLYSNIFQIAMTKCKSSASSIVLPSFFVRQSVNGEQFSNANWVLLSVITVIMPFTRI